MTQSWAGVMGKLPSMGDFVARGISASIRRDMDAWITCHLVHREAALWPAGGLRGLLALSGGLVLFCALPSRDKVGRVFPLVALRDGRGVSLEEAENWCDQAAVHLERLITERAALTAPGTGPSPEGIEDGCPAIWRRGWPPMEVHKDSLAAIFSSA